ncbi:hypothetical protein ClosIBUN22A_CONTIG105g02227 [Clostridium sp. IBUN22A]|nr:hypothetical protein ClosIBUN22A_CONTIG105g02227 [Clostridium sp. IBUN22A]
MMLIYNSIIVKIIKLLEGLIMGKRSSKVIALVLAGMSAAYTIPASAKVIELSEKEGDFSNAIAFNNGKYIYDGYKDDNDSGIY